MSEVKNLVEELRLIHFSESAWHGPGLRKILNDVDTRTALAHPIQGYGSIWELVLHVSKWEELFSLRLKGTPKNLPDEGDWPSITNESETSWQECLKELDSNHEQLIEVVSQSSDSDLEKTVAGKDYTVAYMLHGIVRHHVYHAGQIALLKRLSSNA